MKTGSGYIATRLLTTMAVLAVTCPACSREAPDDGKLHLQYWDKWTRFEGEAMKAVVADFNASQDRIVVHYVPVGLVDRKTLTATAGGDPPDIAGMWEGNLPSYADHGAIVPLDPYMKRDGISRDHFIKIHADICVHRGTMWAVPTTPSTIGLFWNKALFRAAGLDPDRPPRTLAELDDFARKLTTYDENGNIVQMGFLPQEPGWFHYAWGPWFGGALMDGDRIAANHPQNVKAFEWIQQYSREYGVEKIKRFSSGFGNFASPQNPFFSGRIAMVIQGTWMYNYITQYAPGMDWGAAPWPQTPDGPEEFCVAQQDILLIPRGLPKHREEAAWEFIKFAIQRDSMEKLNLGHKKYSPVAELSERFFEEHPNPEIRLFRRMSQYENIIAPPRIGIWSQYNTGIAAAVEKMRLLEIDPQTGEPITAQKVLDQLQARMSREYARHKASLALRGQK